MTKEIITKEENSIVAHVPSQPKGFENFSIDDLIIPRIRLLQDSSTSVKAKQAESGMFQDSLTEELLGDKVEVVPLNFKNGAVFFRVGDGLVCKSNDGVSSFKGDLCASCPFNEYHGAFKADGTPPKCKSTKEFLVLKRDSLENKAPYPMILTFLGGSYPAGKTMASMARLTGEDIFNKSYIISKSIKPYKKGSAFVMTVKPGQKLSDKEIEKASQWHDILSNTKITVGDDEFTTDV